METLHLHSIGRASLWDRPLRDGVALVACGALEDDPFTGESAALVIAVKPGSVEAIALEYTLGAPEPVAVPVRAQAGGREISGVATIAGIEGEWHGFAPVLVHFVIVRDLRIEQAAQALMF